MGLAHTVQVYESLVNLIRASHHLLYEKIQVFLELLALKFIIVRRRIKICRLPDRDSAHLVDKSALLGSQEAQK